MILIMGEFKGQGSWSEDSIPDRQSVLSTHVVARLSLGAGDSHPAAFVPKGVGSVVQGCIGKLPASVEQIACVRLFSRDKDGGIRQAKRFGADLELPRLRYGSLSEWVMDRMECHTPGLLLGEPDHDPIW